MGKRHCNVQPPFFGLQVRAQAYTRATSDGFVLIVWLVIAYLLLMLFLRPARSPSTTLARCNESSIYLTERSEFLVCVGTRITFLNRDTCCNTHIGVVTLNAYRNPGAQGELK